MTMRSWFVLGAVLVSESCREPTKPVTPLAADLLATASEVDLTLGATGTVFFNQSFNGESRGVDITVLSVTNLGVRSMTLREFNITNASTVTVGARIYESPGGALLASADATVESGFDQSVTIPIAATLVAGGRYRIVFFVPTGPFGNSGDVFDPDPVHSLGGFPYDHPSGLVRIEHAYSLATDALPTNDNTAVPMITVDVAPTMHCTAVTGIPFDECEALVAFYNATDGANWGTSSNWLTTTEPCLNYGNPNGWFGVYCVDGHVGWLDTRQNGLTGAIPSELVNLPRLERLLLGGNHLIGPIPSWVGDRTSLTLLDLCCNQLSGPIPPELGNLTSLQYLWLDANQLSGSIPAEFGQLSALQHVALNGNPSLGGEVPLGFAQIADGLGTDHCFLATTDLVVYDTPDYRAADANNDGAICDLPLVPPPDPAVVAASLKSTLTALRNSGALTSGQYRSLSGKIDQAEKLRAKGKYADAITVLQGFIQQVRDLVAKGSITVAQGSGLIAQAQTLIALYGMQMGA